MVEFHESAREQRLDPVKEPDALEWMFHDGHLSKGTGLFACRRRNSLEHLPALFDLRCVCVYILLHVLKVLQSVRVLLAPS